ncbi:Protein arginine methyltransferase NDUFAF7, mitochondrial [Chionoecetes opilio]|uniref:Protein arginine methyltransferase NDUFAF7 n=1 Tax=Chionoecetes opilio TaxID=41210 RepID=A0A8J4YBR0_CHIOP|nr:Protein arginine methyltransferase NDUFAF7, mitochondrial [Chionoecetes opilio]
MLVGVWLLSEWYKLGSPKPLQLVEMGPGRGTLLHDVLKVLSRFGLSGEDISLHLVEVSEELSVKQEKKLCNGESSSQEQCQDELYYKTSTSSSGSPIFWYRHLSLVPKLFTIFLAHEFFDVLPIHKMQRTKEGWREVLIDIDEGDGPHHLRYVLSNAPTPATKIFTEDEDPRASLEVSPEAAVLCKEVAGRMEEHGGIALIIDYGHDGKDTDTFRAYKNHQQQDPLREPGTADLTADVDFDFLKEQVKEQLVTFGPVTQSSFLTNMGIETRLQNLLKDCKPEERRNLISGFRMLTEPKQMGQKFKFLAFYPGVIKDFLLKNPPEGFYRNLE